MKEGAPHRNRARSRDGVIGFTGEKLHVLAAAGTGDGERAKDPSQEGGLTEE